MTKEKPSKLDQFAEKLDEWFGLDKKTLHEVRDLLASQGCSVSLSRLSDWWQRRQQARMEERLLSQISSGARQCREVEQQLSRNPAPEMETLIKLHRVLILKLSTAAATDPEMLDLVGRLMKPTMEFAKLQEKRRELELAEQKYRDQVAERKAAIEAELTKSKAAGGITPETIERIERELKLL